MKRILTAVAVAAAGLAIAGTPASAGPRKAAPQASGAEHPNSSYYRGGPQVRGYVARRGGYSYSAEDSINTYGDSRSKYGAASSLRDPSLDRQTTSGPFDHDFFFDTGNGARNSEAPYMN